MILSAPLPPNINHRSTAFGGSLSAVAILAAWTYVYCQLQNLSLPCRIVIQGNSIEYLQPVETDFQAHCMAPSQLLWDRFIKTITRRGKGRISLNVEICSDALLAGTFQGQYVALKL
ncbi:MAG: YiiD C-terminal domain-containing protein [Cyanobacteria bacterium P01_A01_bin.17]